MFVAIPAPHRAWRRASLLGRANILASGSRLPGGTPDFTVTAVVAVNRCASRGFLFELLGDVKV